MEKILQNYIVQETGEGEYLINLNDFQKITQLLDENGYTIKSLSFYYHAKVGEVANEKYYGGPLDENDSSYFWGETIYSFETKSTKEAAEKLKEFTSSQDYREKMLPAVMIEKLKGK